jgi:hypothetical protein
MDSQQIYIFKLIAWLCKSLGEGSSSLSEMDTDAFGIRLPEAIINNANVQSAARNLNSIGTELAEAAVELENAVQSGNQTEILQAGSKVLEYLIRIFDGLNLFVTEFNNQITPANIPDAAERAIAQDFGSKLARKIIDYLIINVIESTQPQVALILKTLGIIEWTKTNEDPANSLSVAHVKKDLNLHLLKNLFSNPIQHLIDTIGWGSNNFNPADLFYTIEGFYHEEASIFVGSKNGDAFLKRNIFTFRRDSSVTPPGLAVDIDASLNKSVTNRIKLNNAWGIGIDTGIAFSGGLTTQLRPPFSLNFVPNVGDITGSIKLYLNRNPEARPFNIIGGNDLLNLSAQDVSIGAGITVTANVVAGKVAANPLIFSEVKGLKLQLGSSNGDGFLNKLLADTKIEGEFDIGFEWSAETGLKVKASGGTEISIPLHKTIAFIEIDTLIFALKIKDDASLELELSVIFGATLGPLSIAIERMGATSTVKFAEGSDARYGLFDFDFGFKPPNGLGISINAGPVNGGGYLYFDFDKQEYAGALELTIAGFISAKAIGLITTKMPDGSQGFSMLIIITAEFNPAFQLGYGFTLNGVGGLLGLNRTVLLDPLRDGVRTGAVNNIMFPQNVVANATRIISDLKAIFPVHEGKFLIGPMAKIGWGTPTLVSLSFGLIIEIPGNIAILGVLSVILPAKEAALVKIQVAFVGTIDFDKQMLTFDASLYESSILTMTLEGDMAVRLKWGDNPDFLFTVGGFHPSYTPPPLALPTLKRLAINILNTSVARIRVECYQAITSNTVQFGAKADIFFGLDECSISGYISFDALFQFSPFYFIISVSAGFKLRVVGIDLLSVRIKMSLEGPTPWRAKGTGSISILFFEVSADFDETWGESRNTVLPDKAILTELLEVLHKKEQWSTALSTNKNLYVSLRKLEASVENTIVLHSAGTLVVQQKLLPFTINIDKIGNQNCSDVKNVNITSAKSGSITLHVKSVNDDFARAQYQKLSDAEKLSKPSFEKMPGGVEISMSGNPIKNGKLVRKKVEYELTIVDKTPQNPLSGFLAEMPVLFGHFLKGNSTAKSLLSKATAQQLQPFDEKIEVFQSGYSIAFQNTNTLFNTQTRFNSEAAAQTHLQDLVKDQPNLKKQIHIIPNFELQEA